jgi:putative ABC transport system ATP-binding protein
LSRSARSSFAGKAASAGSPKPAVSESPNATTRTIRSAAGSGQVDANASTSAITSRAKRWTGPRRPSYDGDGADPVAIERRNERQHMQDTLASGRADLAIELSGVNLSLGRGAARVHILKDINLQIEHGEAIGLLGPSGSGKSTLLMVTAGLERVDSGSVVVAGAALAGMSEDALARFRARNIGIVFQSFHLIPTMTALENVAVPLELAGIEDAEARAARELAAVGLAERHNHYPAELSGGEQQRVAVARALAPNPPLLIADEPTGNLDETTGAEIIDLLFAGHAQRGSTLLLVTHDMALTGRCYRVVRLRSGRIADEGPRAAQRTRLP